MTKLLTFLFLFGGHLSVDGRSDKHVRLLLDNPANMASYLGYKDHHIHDMSSLVNEAQAQAHGNSGSGPGTGSGTPYNVPNFPGQTGQSDTGTQRTGHSFAGTNLWRCDAHVVDVCDLNCLDVDPKDGCPFCVQSCQTALHSQGIQTGTFSSGSQSGPVSSGSISGSSSGAGTQSGIGQSGTPFQQPSSGTGAQISAGQSGSPFKQPSQGTGAQSSISQSGSPFHQPSSGAGTGTHAAGSQSGTASQQTSGMAGAGTQTGGSQSGSISQQPSGLTGTGAGTSQSGQLPSGLTGTGMQSGSSQPGSIVQQPSGLSGTGSQSAGQGTAGSAGTQTTAKPLCPYYPPNCPAIYTKLSNGCLVCTIVQQMGIATNAPTTAAAPVTTQGPTCPPKRCVPPCNIGIIMGADGCPHCKCPNHV